MLAEFGSRGGYGISVQCNQKGRNPLPEKTSRSGERQPRQKSSVIGKKVDIPLSYENTAKRQVGVFKNPPGEEILAR